MTDDISIQDETDDISIQEETDDISIQDEIYTNSGVLLPIHIIDSYSCTSTLKKKKKIETQGLAKTFQT